MCGFTITDRFYQLPVFKAVCGASSRGSVGNQCRENIIIRMLVLASAGIKFVNAAQMAHFIMASENQCNIVWSVCVECNVLRQKDGYYSAYEWLCENGFIANIRNDVTQSCVTDTNKTALANNVYLTDEQIEEIKKELPGDLFQAAVDMLSRWKDQKGNVACNDDYYHFKKWVINAAKKEESEKKKGEPKSQEYYQNWISNIYPGRFKK